MRFSSRDLAKILWDFNHLHHALDPADFIFVMCSYNLIVADKAADLFHHNMGEFVAVSGGIAHHGDLLETPWNRAEGIVFADRLIECGVPEDKIIIEDKATNCGENTQFTKALFKEQNITTSSGIIVQKPYMERRAYATACKQWPEMQWCVTCPQISYEAYIKENEEERLIHILVGDTQRVIDYADKGFQIPQEMPDQVKKALDTLSQRGYNKHTIKTV